MPNINKKFLNDAKSLIANIRRAANKDNNTKAQIDAALSNLSTLYRGRPLKEYYDLILHNAAPELKKHYETILEAKVDRASIIKELINNNHQRITRGLDRIQIKTPDLSNSLTSSKEPIPASTSTQQNQKKQQTTLKKQATDTASIKKSAQGITEEDKQKAAYLMSEKIKKYGGQMLTEKERNELLNNPQGKISKEDYEKGMRFNKDEFDSILAAGLIKGAEGGAVREFKDEAEWNKAVYETASSHLKKQDHTPSASRPRFSISTPSSIRQSIPDITNFGKNIGANLTSKGGIFLKKGIQVGGGAVAKGGAQLLGKGAAALLGLGSGPVGLALLALSSLPKLSELSIKAGKSTLMITVAGVLAIFILPSLLESLAFFPPYEIAESAPVSTQPPTSIASCKFTRSDQNPKDAAYSSPTLLSYIQEASKLSTVPAVVLAGFIRVESPTMTSYTDANLSTAPCAESSTGALGIMQLQPEGTTGHDAAAITLGAKLINKEYEDLTREDYCDMKKNIIMGSGFILKKMSYFGYGNGTKWDPAWNKDRYAINALVNGYYGCLLYGGEKDCTGPYNYGDDLWNSIQNCNSTSTYIASCPVLNGQITFPSYNAGPPPSGHCTAGSAEGICPAACPTSGRRAKAIDVDTSGGKDVVLPTIEGREANWKLIQKSCGAPGFSYPNCGSANGGTGALYTFEGELFDSPDKWYLQLIHMDVDLSWAAGEIHASGQIIGKTDFTNIVHVSIGKNIKNPLESGSDETDCDQGWLAADAMCPAP